MEEKIRLFVGARLREERERLGFSQSAFAALGGISLRTEQDWERGVSAVKSDFLAVAASRGVDVLYVVTGVRAPIGPDAGRRLVEERRRVNLSAEELAARCGVSVQRQSAFEAGSEHRDSEYLEALAANDVDVSYVLTGHRMLMQGYVAPTAVPEQYRPGERLAPAPLVAAEPPPSAGNKTVLREVTPEEAALLDNYEAADEKGRAAARGVLDALAQPKAANG